MGYSRSRLRIALLLILFAAAAFLASDGFAQATQPAAAAGAAGAPADPKPAGLIQLILGNLDPVFWTIAILSVTGLTLIIQGFIKTREAVLIPPATTNTIREMIEQRRFRELVDFTENDPSFVSKALNPALKRAPSFPAMKEAMETAVGEQTAEQFRKIEYLNIIGNLGPLLGLLGTVLGMIHAFSTMQAKGGATTPADLAGGVSIALTHTFLGLFLAIPCLAAFGVLRTMVDRLTIRGALVAEELLLMIKPADPRSGSSVPATPVAATAPPRPTAAPQPARVVPPPYPAPPTA